MKTIVFDTLDYVKRAKEAGIPEKQAEFQAEETAKLINNNLVTKKDLEELRTSTKMDLKNEIKDLKNYMLITIGSASIGIVALLDFILKH